MESHVFIAIYLLIVLVILCLIPMIVFFSKIENNILRTLFYFGTFGGIGGVVYSKDFHHII